MTLIPDRLPTRVRISTDTAWRRAVDIAVAALALVALAPTLVAIGLAIRVTSPGPALYLQERIGRGGRPFRVLKFRTMVVGADRGGALVSGRRDVRITALGTLLRATHLDELPQVLNVLRGEMTLIGPRPEVARYVALYAAGERFVLDVRPGLTGPGQLYFSTDQAAALDRVGDPEQYYISHQLHPKLRVDLDYLEHRSLRRDLAVVVNTLAVLAGRYCR